MTKQNSKKEFSFVHVTTETVSCSGSSARSKHPLVYLNILPKGSAKCPYCGIEFIYQNQEKEERG